MSIAGKLKELNQITLMLLNQCQNEGMVEGMRNVAKFNGANDNGTLSTDKIVGIGIAVLVLSYIISMAVGNFYTTDTSQWCKTDSTGARVPDTMAQNLWWLIPAFVIIGIVLLVIKNK